MADEEDQPVTPVAPPPQAALPRGTGYTYSTPGPGNWQNPQTVAGPANVPVQIPQNAQNFTSIVGPPPEDQETAAFRKMFNSLPMDQAIKAYQSAKQFQVSRLAQNNLQRDLANGVPYQEAYTKFMMTGAAGGLFSTPKEMLDLNKNLTEAAAKKMQAEQAVAKMKATQEFAPTEVTLPSGTRAVQTRPGSWTVPKEPSQGGLSAQNREVLKSLDSEEKELRKDLARTAYWKPAQLTPEGKQEYSSKTNRLAQIVAKKQMLAPEPTLPTEKAPTAQAEPAPPREKRVVGKIYQTPSGPHKWTGKGWVAVNARTNP